jgi:hypothetical protein
LKVSWKACIQARDGKNHFRFQSGFWSDQKPPKNHRKTTEKPPKNHQKPPKNHFEKPLRIKTPGNCWDVDAVPPYT